MKCLQVLVLGVTLIAVANAADSQCIKGTNSANADSAACAKKDDKCVAVFDFSGGTPDLKEAGCKGELTIPCTADNIYCIECEGKDCNQGITKMVKVKCYKCDSKTDRNCVKAPSTVTTTDEGYLCSTTLLPADTDGLVHNVRAAINTKEALNSCKKAPETCKLCDKASCNIDEPLTRNKCATDICLKPSDSCVATYKDTGELTSSGCKQEIDCSGKICKECTGNGCTENLTPLKCIQCIHDPADPFCTTKYSSLKAESCKLDQKCFVANVNGINTRGCTSTDTCTNGASGEDCYVCNEDNCNNIKFPEYRNECKDKEDKTLVCLNPSDVCVGAYSNYGELLSSGCKEDISCVDKLCTACTELGNVCAKNLPIRKCVQCDHDDDPSCTTNPYSLEAKPCQLDEKCFVTNVNGINTRGCTSADECLNGASGADCHVCDKDNCNNIKFPENRNECKDKDDKTLVCLNPSDECVGLYSSNGVKEKEVCAAENKVACAAAGRLCLKCDATEGCKADISNSCYTCPATGSCDVTSAETPLVHSCTGCSINIAADGKITRKCAVDKEECKSSLNCKKCTGMLCNSNEVKSNAKKCYQCKKEKEGCGKQLNATAVENTDCTAKTIGGFDVCYAFRKEINRGCLSSLIASNDYGKCTADGECDVCPDDGCNKQDINASAIATGAILLVAFGVLAASITN